MEDVVDRVPSVIVGVGLFLVALAAYWIPGQERFYNHFVWQAAAFLAGHSQIQWPVAPFDGSWGNSYYQDVMPWPGPHGEPTGYGLIPFPPLPAIVLMPFVALWGVVTDERAVSVVLGAIDATLCWWALGGLRVSGATRLATAVFFAFGSVFWYAAQLGTTWFFAHVVALAPLLLAIGLALRADRDADADPRAGGGGWTARARAVAADVRVALVNPASLLDGRQLLVGFLFGVACTARLSIVFGAPFFALVGGGGSVLRRGASAALGAALPITALLAYNLATTGSVVHPGYDYQYHREAVGYPDLNYHDDWGIEDVRYIPQNLGIMFASLPVLFPDRVPRSVIPGAPLCQEGQTTRRLFDDECPIALPRDTGLSILVTSPLYLLMLPPLLRFGRSRLVAAGWIAVTAIALVGLMHFSQGWVQFGYRFSNDFIAFALPVVALGMRGALAQSATMLLLPVSVAIQLWGVTWGNKLGW